MKNQPTLIYEEYNSYYECMKFGGPHVLYHGEVAKVPPHKAKRINNMHLALTKKYCLIYFKN